MVYVQAKSPNGFTILWNDFGDWIDHKITHYLGPFGLK